MTRKRWDIPKRAVKTLPQADQNNEPKQLTSLLGFFPKAALALNGLLAGAGYLFLSGYLSKLGINISELEIGLPSLLFYGYSFVIEALINASFLVMVGTLSIPTLAVMFTLIPVMERALPKWRSNLREVTAVVASTVMTVTILLGPALIFNSGSANATRSELRKMGITSPDSTDESHIVATPTGKIEGTLIIADQRYTYLRANNTIYKISNDTQKVIRTIEFKSPAPEASEEKHVENKPDQAH